MCKAGWRDAFDLEGRSRALVGEHLRDWCVCWHPQLKLWVIIFLAAAHKPFLWSLYAQHIPALYHFLQMVINNNQQPQYSCVQQLLKPQQLP